MNKSLAIKNLNLEDINVIIAGAEDCEKSHTFGPAIRNCFLFHYILKGKGVFESNGIKYNLKKGEGFLICPGYSTIYYADESEPWSYVWIGIDGTGVDMIMDMATVSYDSPIFCGENNHIVGASFEKLEKYVKDDIANPLLLLSVAYNILGGLEKEEYSAGSSRAEIYVNKAVSYIEANYYLPLGVDTISRIIGIDRKYFCFIFKKFTGYTPIKYIMKIKVDNACYLLKNTTNSVGDIARSVGYEDIFSFSRMFTKYTGYAPSKYRKK